ncbi:TPA: hypothetical protein N0F65_008374 [Lagenidium giganteum]|uniref:Uncharacterized protein n=1 Tax=Lagenidium giganteum TaxID=4803 RepID=A0AAV2Z034_9STRA|nr:TPA: hypothetical protein N0F65_008374 [Lagenidium giganteum]
MDNALSSSRGVEFAFHIAMKRCERGPFAMRSACCHQCSTMAQPPVSRRCWRSRLSSTATSTTGCRA